MQKVNAPAPSTRHLPASLADLEAQRIVKRSVSLLDEVEQCYLALFNDAQFRLYREAIEPEETQEGSLQDDDTISAEMIRAKAKELELPLASVAKYHDIRLKLRAAERRVNASRSQRQAASA